MNGEKLKMEKFKPQNKQLSIIYRSLKVCLFLLISLFFLSCNEIKTPKTEVFIGENSPPPKQEFRWSNGKTPKSFDPARAAASPETDVVRAIYEGLTDIDSKTSQVIPALATKWTSSPDFKTWTFQLRQDAKWTNGEAITSEDFVSSWKRLTELGDKVPQRRLFKNIVGMDSEDVMPIFADESLENPKEIESNKSANQKSNVLSNANSAQNSNSEVNSNVNISTNSNRIVAEKSKKKVTKARFGVEATGDFSLKITLVEPDSEFPILVAHPIFRPIYGDGIEFETNGLDSETVTNGAFKISAVTKEGILLERNPNYWNKDEIKLERVRFVPTENAEQALAAYRAGEVDLITNANFQPLALKLLQPFDEFHQTIHGALNYYEFNLKSKPFDDLRVRKALAISIERKRLTEDDMDGATEPALAFLPFENHSFELKEDVDDAKKLLSEAGFTNGENFPTIKLLINRNDMQQKIARSIAKMWEKNLNIKTEIIVKDRDDFENLIQIGDFNLVRRGIVLPTHNEIENMTAMFEHNPIVVNKEIKQVAASNSNTNNQILNDKTAESNLSFEDETDKKVEVEKNTNSTQIAENQIITNEEQALKEIPAIPLYFPTSYSVVKPYIKGFELNAFDVLSLKNVEIDSDWQPNQAKTISNTQNQK